MQELGILVVDDHPVYREALSDKLRSRFESGALKVATAPSAGEGLELVQQLQARRWVVILDILMPGLSGLAGIRAFKSQAQVDHVVAISGLDEKVWEARALGAGAALFISKNSTSDSIARRIVPLLAQLGAETAPAEAAAPSFRLTTRQREVLSLIGLGHPNKIIADQLQISEQTVKIHVNQIFKELRVYNRTQAVLAAQKYELL
jgi:DNA-binding NarL/FixJ family response regulator